MNLRPLWIACYLLTRLPVPFTGQTSAEETGRSVAFYPLVGLLMGLPLALAGAVLGHTDPAIAAALILALWLWLSGGIHIDGLGDSADAWVGGLGSRERTLEIMKDPRCGPAAVSAIVMVLLLKWAGIQALLNADAPLLLLLAPLIGRTQLSLLLLTTPYAREQGMAADQSRHLPRRATALASLAALLACPLLAGGTGALLPLLALALLYLGRRNMLQRIGGFTGDTAGAMVEITEAALLVAAALLATGAWPGA